jgi:hypothetical protein
LPIVQPPQIISRPYYGNYGDGGYGAYGGYAGPGGYWGWGSPTRHGTSTTKTWGLFGTRETKTVYGPDGTYTVHSGLGLDTNGHHQSGLTLNQHGFSLQLGPLHFEGGQAHLEFPAGF